MKKTEFKEYVLEEVQLIYKTSCKSSERPQVSSSRDAYYLFLEFWDPDTIEHTEEFKIMLLNCAHRVLGIASLSKGGISGSVIDVRIILQYALKANASAIIMAHNHPSGNLNPSQADISISKKVKEAARLLDIILLDHLVITLEAFYSMLDSGII